MKTIYLGLGSNVGNRKGNIDSAISLLKRDIDILKISSVYKTSPIGYLDQDDFYNIALKGLSLLSIHQLIGRIQEIEEQIGRKKIIKWGPRLIDIDILLYGNDIILFPEVTVPHLELTNRRFVLEPLFEIDPTLIIPPEGKSVQYYLNFVQDQVVEKLVQPSITNK